MEDLIEILRNYAEIYSQFNDDHSGNLVSDLYYVADQMEIRQKEIEEKEN